MNTSMRAVPTGLATIIVIAISAGISPAADFVLFDSEHLDVTTFYSTGRLYDTSTADVRKSSGYIYRAYVNDEACLRVLGGQVRELWAYGTSTAAISGGEVRELYAYDHSTVAMSGGSVSNYISALEHSTVVISGGSVGS